MAQSVSTILAQTGDLAARARRYTGDMNEASLLVGRVMSRAFSELGGEENEAVIASVMTRDLERLIQQRERHA